ncbi:hypothetical protein K503DRAFT_805667 [Rhizopogon vinicolor AM-OR11-026]|uniref:Uncharacterized protein n=1 Tax=Rhizopogon vinicolor AM-OR11-026 TaxID=1314800 RepID=A0A1B7MH42_9AGAM|nr:hypothetical protein K503DRAFT_805667 [Rhizopogon vinicolor AM-OR11-026]
MGWKSHEEIEKDSLIFMKLNHALLGLYAWEFIVSLDFDWAVLTGKKKFRWPLIIYFAGRYLLLFAMIGITLTLDTPSEINCQALCAFNQLAGDAAVRLASINLALRTIAIWLHNKRVIVLLVLMVVWHWSLMLRGMLLTAIWVPGVGCQITNSNTTILAVMFIYSMCFDFVVMCLSAYKLVPAQRGTKGTHTKFIGMLFTDGLIYFLTAYV